MRRAYYTKPNIGSGRPFRGELDYLCEPLVLESRRVTEEQMNQLVDEFASRHIDTYASMMGMMDREEE